MKRAKRGKDKKEVEHGRRTQRRDSDRATEREMEKKKKTKTERKKERKKETGVFFFSGRSDLDPTGPFQMSTRRKTK